MSPFFNLLRGLRQAVKVRRKLSGPLRPTWDPTFETLAEMFHQGSIRITRLPLDAQRRATQSVVLGLQQSPLYKETSFEKLTVAGVPAEWFRRTDTEGRTLLYFHGGGYGLGTIETHRDLVARICRASRADALTIEYRLAPEHKFPAQLEDALGAYEYLLSLGIPPNRIFVGGDSAGGGLTLALLVRLRELGRPLPALGVCLSPWVDLEATGATIDQNDRYDYISRRAINQYRKRFVEDADIRNPLAAPLYADLHGLPPLLIQAGSAETLLDDSRRIAARARDHGVDVTFRIWEDMIHVWQLFAFMVPQGAAAIDELGAFVRERMPV
ncbi:MAG TPA: alpha/beta hydrolase [Polyangiaceae bacterium]|nr:alpha/beta hydrolase [Polyangiaceae bacterium]